MELLKCGQCGDKPGLLMSVVDRSAGIKINLCYGCYKTYARHVKGGKSERVAVVYDEGVSAR
jgi:hypothetical protein